MATNGLQRLVLLAVCVGMVPATVANGNVALPLHERFASETLDAAWSPKASPEASVKVTDGWLAVEGPLDGVGHIERQLGIDNITLSATVVRWGAVYLVWDADNWCGVGMLSPTPFGRFYSIDVVGGKAREVDDRGVDFGCAHRVRIVLGQDHVRLQSHDGEKWIDMRTIERPTTFAGAPKRVAVGKYYGADHKPFRGPADVPGVKVSGLVGDLRIEATPPAVLTLTEAEREAVRRPPGEPVNAVLTQNDDDPTFEAIAGHYPPMKSPREVVGVPVHPLDLGVDCLGRLDVTPWGAPTAWFEIGDPPVPFGGGNGAYFTWDRSATHLVPGLTATITRRLLAGYLPVVILSTSRDDVDYELMVFAISEGFRVDTDLYAYARLTARSRGGRVPEQLALAWGSGETRHVWPAKARDGSARWCVRFKHPQPETASEITADAFEAKLVETAAFWRNVLAPAERFDMPDRRVMEAYRAWIVYSLLNCDTIDGYVEPHDGAGFYEQMFGNSVSLHTWAMNMYGLHDHAARVLDTQIHFQQPDGLYTQVCGLTDPGGFLVGLIRQYQFTGDRAWLERVSPSIIKQCEWLVRQRAAGPADGMTRGLIKFRPYNDYAEPVFNYLGNVWCARGLELSGAALKDIGAEQADAFAIEAAKYRQDILDSMDAAAFADNGQTILPMEPDTQRLLKLSKYTGGDYYGLVASPLLGTGFLPPRDKRANRLMDIIEKRAGLIAGVCEFERGIDHAYTYGYLTTAMKRGEERKTLLGFWSFLAFGMTRDTYSPVEVTNIRTGHNHYTLPHLYSCTDQLRLVRDMLLHEQDDTLWLGRGIPRAWLAPGKHVAVNDAPTEFGNMSYRIDAEADDTMRIHIDPPQRRMPMEVCLRLRHPQKRSIASVTATPSVAVEVSGDTLRLPDLHTPVDLEVRCDAGR
ncbi:MAG: hypothetical protein JXA69_01920 [Phycisphaerae bacterium]|nr:hypothetical protein [Phycisphaerae bacterium]